MKNIYFIAYLVLFTNSQLVALDQVQEEKMFYLEKISDSGFVLRLIRGLLPDSSDEPAQFAKEDIGTFENYFNNDLDEIFSAKNLIEFFVTHHSQDPYKFLKASPFNEQVPLDQITDALAKEEQIHFPQIRVSIYGNESLASIGFAIAQAKANHKDFLRLVLIQPTIFALAKKIFDQNSIDEFLKSATREEKLSALQALQILAIIQPNSYWAESVQVFFYGNMQTYNEDTSSNVISMHNTFIDHGSKTFILSDKEFYYQKPEQNLSANLFQTIYEGANRLINNYFWTSLGVSLATTYAISSLVAPYAIDWVMTEIIAKAHP